MSAPGQFVVDGTTGDVLTIAAPAAPAYIAITALELTVSATSTVTLKSASTVIDKAYLGTGNSYSREGDVGIPVLKCDPGEAFVIGNTAGTIAGAGVYAVMGAG